MTEDKILVAKRMNEISRIDIEYRKMLDWRVRENANTNTSFSNFISFLVDKIVKKKEVLSYYLPTKSVEMYFNGDIHIHKLPNSIWIPYCAGWSFQKILKMGLKTPTIISSPAKHIDTAVSHVINFFFLTAQEWTGATAMSAFDLYAAPFVYYDKADYKSVKQAMQKMLYELNYPSRMGYQSPFTNITLMIDTSPEILEGDAIVGGRKVGSLGDFIEEAITIDKALMDLYLEGDAFGQPFTFPIPTLMLTKNFDWNGRRWGDLVDRIFYALARKGVAYLLNGYATNIDALYAMCCRLTIDTSKINNHVILSLNAEDDVGEYLRKNRQAYGIWALPDATGSIGVVTINLPRLGILSKGDWNLFEELLLERLKIAREVLLTWRKRYEESLYDGLMPLTKIYLGHFNNHFNTFGIIGLPEAAAAYMNDPKLWVDYDYSKISEAVKIMKKMVSLVRKVAEEYEEIDGYLYNVEEIPGESTGYRLAKLDYKKFRDKVERGDIFIPRDGEVPFYSNSIIPYYANIPISLRAKWEGEVQREFTGGVMMHLFLYESPDPKALKKLVQRIAMNTKVVYFSITPTISVCRKCGWSSVGVYDKCLKCGSNNLDLWSRIVGYYRPVRNWNIGKKAEFKLRKTYGGKEL